MAGSVELMEDSGWYRALASTGESGADDTFGPLTAPLFGARLGKSYDEEGSLYTLSDVNCVRGGYEASIARKVRHVRAVWRMSVYAMTREKVVLCKTVNYRERKKFNGPSGSIRASQASMLHIDATQGPASNGQANRARERRTTILFGTRDYGHLAIGMEESRTCGSPLGDNMERRPVARRQIQVSLHFTRRN